MISCVVAVSVSAAVPGSFQMQAVATDGGAGVLANAEVTVRLSLRQGKADGKSVYVETHGTTTDGLGVITVHVGEGAAASGDFSAIAWGEADMFIETEIDKGAGFVPAGTSRICAVPFAKVADKASRLQLTSASGKRFEVSIDDEGNLKATPIAD